MDTNLKNKHVYFLLFIISVYLFGLSMISGVDIKNNKSFLQKEPYFKSDFFKGELLEYFDGVKTLIAESKDVKEDNSENLNIDTYYESAENQIKLKESLRYYIKDKDNGKIYTNIKDLKNIDDYIKNNSVYVEKFPKNSTNNNELQTIDNWFQRNNCQGSFIFIKTSGTYSQMKKNYIYYNSIRQRIIKEIVLLISTLILAVSLLVFLRLKLRDKCNYVRIERRYEKIPIDVKIIIFIIYSLIMKIYFQNLNFFYVNISFRQFVILSVYSLYSLYIITNVDFVLRMIRYKEISSQQFSKSIIGQIIILMNQCKGILIKEILLSVSTIFFGFFCIYGLFGLFNNIVFICIFSFIYIIIYLMIVPLHIVKRAASLNKIIKATDAIASGDLDYCIEETLDSNFEKISKNINNINKNLKKSVDSQVKSERLKTELIANVSHDLKTPLTSIINYVNLLKEGAPSEDDRQKYINILDQKSQRLKLLIEDLFEASKVSSGALEMHIEKVDIVSLLRQSLGELDQKIAESSLTFRTNISEEPVYLNLDGKRTWRVFENLIINAVKYSQDYSRVYIDMLEEDDKVKIIFKNVSSYEMNFDADELFERFKRGDKARSSEGSGLGLSIAKSIVELQGGSMKIDIDGDLFKVTVEFTKS